MGRNWQGQLSWAQGIWGMHIPETLQPKLTKSILVIILYVNAIGALDHSITFMIPTVFGSAYQLPLGAFVIPVLIGLDHSCHKLLCHLPGILLPREVESGVIGCHVGMHSI